MLMIGRGGLDLHQTLLVTLSQLCPPMFNEYSTHSLSFRVNKNQFDLLQQPAFAIFLLKKSKNSTFSRFSYHRDNLGRNAYFRKTCTRQPLTIFFQKCLTSPYSGAEFQVFCIIPIDFRSPRVFHVYGNPMHDSSFVTFPFSFHLTTIIEVVALVFLWVFFSKISQI